MIRSVVILLLLAVFFLSGTLYGMNSTNNNLQANNNSNKVEQLETTASLEKHMEKVEVETPQTVKEDVMDMENNIQLTQNTASFLETSVQGFFELVVGILYQIAEIFF